MRTAKIYVTSIFLAQLFSFQAGASVDVEIDPATYIFKGDSLHIKLTPYKAPQWRLGVGTYGMEMPDLLIEANDKNKNKNWDVEIERAYGFFTEYYFHPSQSGWFVGGQVSQQKYKIENTNVNPVEFSNALLMMNVGYKWSIKNSSFYLLPWAGVGYTKTIDKNSERIASGFDVNPMVAFMSVHLGYEF